MTARMLPYGRQCIEDDDVAAVAAVLTSDFLTTGPLAARFEAALAARVGAAEAVCCSSGTAALHLAMLALDLAPGDVVVVPAVTFLATANAVRFVGGEVLFADVDADTGLMGATHLEQALERAGAGRARAVIPVHLNGQAPDPQPVAAAAAARGLEVIEDASHALGTKAPSGAGAGMPVGGCRHARMATFSFHAVKAVACGEGGAVTTNDPRLADRMRRLRNHGMVHASDSFENRALAFDREGAPNPWYYEMPEVGFNYRASDIHCALGLSQLAKLDRFTARRRALADRYDRLLAPLASLVRPVAKVPGCDPAWHLYAVRIDFTAAGIERAKLMRDLRGRGIGTQVHYLPLHRQPYYRRRYGDMELPGADAYYARTLSLPLFVGMEDSDVDRVVDALGGVLGRASGVSHAFSIGNEG